MLAIGGAKIRFGIAAVQKFVSSASAVFYRFNMQVEVFVQRCLKFIANENWSAKFKTL